MIETTLLFFGVSLAIGVAAVFMFYHAAYGVRSQIFGPTSWCGDANNGSVSLTFDDGPSPDTVAILDTLRDENLKATFFLIGDRVEAYPSIARRIVNEGHEIGNHSFTHPLFLFCSEGKIRSELEKTQAAIEMVTGVKPVLVRPPCGVRSRAFFKVAFELDLRTVQWSDTGYDWKKIPAERIARNVLETVRSDSIVLLHDGDDSKKNTRGATAEALPLIIDGLRKKNLRVVPIGDLCFQNQKGAAMHKDTKH